MALWTVTASQNHDVYTVVYLLKDALRSALSDAWFFERTALQRADIKGAGHAEIAARLGRFRDSCKTFQEREALMLTKILRARTWALELKKLAPEIQQDIDHFVEATEGCERMQGDFLKDAQRMFNGGTSLSRFLSLRRPEPCEDTSRESRISDGAAYLVGGKTALYQLRAACETFLNHIDEEFFSPAPEKTKLQTPILAYLDAVDELPEVGLPEAVH